MTFGHWLFGISALALSVILMIRFFRFDRIRTLSLDVILVMYLCHILQQMGAAFILLSDPTAISAPAYLVACSVTALLIPIGALIGNLMLPVKISHIVRFRHYPVADDVVIRRATWRFFFLLFCFCLTLFILYAWKTKTMPLRMLISGYGRYDPEQLIIARREATAMGRFFGMGFVFFMPFLFVTAIIGLSYFKSILVKFVCIAALCVAFLYNAWPASKSPVAMLFLLVVIVLLLQKDEVGHKRRLSSTYSTVKKAIRKRRCRIYLLISFFLVLIVGYPVLVFLLLPVSSQGMGYILKHVFLRIVFKPAMNSYTAFEAFTHTWDYTYFSDIQMLADLFGWKYTSLSTEIAVYKGLGTFTNAPPTAVGNFYAQGGWPILVCGVLIASALFKVIENIFYHARVKTVPHVALYALLLYGAFRFSWANFHTILATETIAPLIIMLIVWRFFRRVRWHHDDVCFRSPGIAAFNGQTSGGTHSTK